MRRHLLGLIALVSLLLAAVLSGYPPLADYQTVGAMSLRVGLVLGAVWLAWPDLHRLPAWVWYILPIGFAALIYARGILVFLFPALAIAMAAYLLYRKLWRSPH